MKIVFRRDILKLGAGASVLNLTGLQKAFAKDPAATTRFDANTVREKARKLARSAYAAPAQTLPSQINNLNFDQFRGIEFRSERALWAEDDLYFDVEFFPRGFLYRPKILMNEVIDGETHPIAYDPDMFKYQDQQLRVTDDLGFSGLRLRCPLNKDDMKEECAVFLGASYFRAVAKGQNYGLSARGFANGTGDPKGEEFALFREFWLEKPQPGVKSVVIHALMDSPSVVGAFHFTIKPGDTTVFDVQTSFFPRENISKGGIAALTGMFYFDSNNRHHVDDWRPGAHDSEALQMWTGERQQLFRPLNNPIDLQFSAFHDVNPQGFGLMQRRRAFRDFEDLALFYEKRPSLWIEPVGNWGEGAVDLVEIPTPNEVNDNIVSFWRPAEPMKSGNEYSYTYRMYWGWDTPWPTDMARIGATRIGEVTDHPDARQIVVDFTGKPFENLPDNASFHLIWETSAGSVKNVVVEPNPNIKGWRTMFEFYPKDAKIAELQCQLANDQGPVSEKWIYRWTP
ncbi:glucan biosynthesis protein G [Candidatus Kirkpatrickella diaphorinae]|uniref:Glucan biosynthesis protein G n=1 Tax=Candidatus Kirkpatrickella diaphorinae TaxID=2984322 RepID=A0ABY6GI02_9PROT|nr:glucan biosynthesis protein G [Candidatus Kirkpatrickella diaphorinae]UYH50952.1 glucan biosynthesis protein G [Candidatus Kirkpatrickella diaphorinae]